MVVTVMVWSTLKKVVIFSSAESLVQYPTFVSPVCVVDVVVVIVIVVNVLFKHYLTSNRPRLYVCAYVCYEMCPEPFPRNGSLFF